MTPGTQENQGPCDHQDPKTGVTRPQGPRMAGRCMTPGVSCDLGVGITSSQGTHGGGT